MQIIDAAAVSIKTVHKNALEQKSLHEMLPLILEGAADIPCTSKPAEDFSKWSLEDLRAASNYHTALQNLKSFVDAAALTNVPPNVGTVLLTPGEKTLSASDLLLICEIACATRDVASLAATMRKDLLQPLSEPKHVMDKDILLEWVPFVLKCWHTATADLERLAMAKESINIEAAGIPLVTPVSLVREWQCLLRTFVARCCTCMLDEYVKLLQKDIDKCRASVPQWEASFVGDVWNTNMAHRMMKSVLPKIVDSHNTLHNTLNRMSSAAQSIDLRPRLQEHDQTAEVIAVALQVMQLASTGAVVAMGVEVHALANDPSGPTRAAAFLKQNRTDKLTKAIPRAFWTDIEAISSLSPASVTADPKSKHVQGASPGAEPSKPDGAPSASAPVEGPIAGAIVFKRTKSEAAIEDGSGGSPFAAALVGGVQGPAATRPKALKRMRK